MLSGVNRLQIMASRSVLVMLGEKSGRKTKSYSVLAVSASLWVGLQVAGILLSLFCNVFQMLYDESILLSVYKNKYTAPELGPLTRHSHLPL